MSLARSNLIARARILREAAESADLVSRPPAETKWNEHARLVKVALCLSAFTSLEEFVQGRIREVVSKLDGYAPASRGLPEAMKNALVGGTFDAVIARLKDPARFGITDVRSFLVVHSKNIASFGSAGLSPSDLALSSNGSNVSWKVLEDALVAFAVENPSSVLNGVARRIEGGIFVAKDHFENVLKWRHRVAHVADTDVPLADVREYVDKLTLISASFDLVLSTAASRLLAAAFSPGPPSTKNVDIKLRFVEKYGGHWRDRVEARTRGASRDADRSVVIFSSEAAARAGAECVVIRRDGMTSATDSWSTPFL